MIRTIVAFDEKKVIGNKNQLIWHLPNDLKRFKKLTTGHPIIMGRNTYQSIGKPLPNRTNIVISNSLISNSIENILVVKSLSEALAKAKEIDSEIYIIGGGQVYKEAIYLSDKLEVTEVHSSFEGDTFFPEIDLTIWEEVHRIFNAKDEKHKFDYSFVTYTKKNTNWEEPKV